MTDPQVAALAALHEAITDRLFSMAGSDGDMCAQDWHEDDTAAVAAGVRVGDDGLHDWTTDDRHDYAWCRRCLLVRQANGSSDAKPCKGPSRVRPRAALARPAATPAGIDVERRPPDQRIRDVIHEANLRALPAEIDVERLARALRIVTRGTWSTPTRNHPDRQREQDEAWLRDTAAKVAAAYEAQP